MRLREFASAEEQMALWKLITQNVWTAIDDQARQQAAERAAKAQAAKPKRAKRSSGSVSPRSAPKSGVKAQTPDTAVTKAAAMAQPQTAALQGAALQRPSSVQRLQPRMPTPRPSLGQVPTQKPPAVSPAVSAMGMSPSVAGNGQASKGAVIGPTQIRQRLQANTTTNPATRR
ncbi:MAG: hypothetical protein EB072_19675 [Betaproteobacteria bacterium]|nr:hypothetical protein [Betaproteobacteria bacterium]